jgi:hypothetical protein
MLEYAMCLDSSGADPIERFGANTAADSPFRRTLPHNPVRVFAKTAVKRLSELALVDATDLINFCLVVACLRKTVSP